MITISSSCLSILTYYPYPKTMKIHSLLLLPAIVSLAIAPAVQSAPPAVSVTSVVKADSTSMDFGKVTFGKDKTLQLGFENTSSNSLQIDIGSNGRDFFVHYIESRVLILNPGQKLTIGVVCRPTKTGLVGGEAFLKAKLLVKGKLQSQSFRTSVPLTCTGISKSSTLLGVASSSENPTSTTFPN
jgi:hypothetical protein